MAEIWGVAIAGVAAAGATAYAANKSADAAADSYHPLDVNSVITDARTSAAQNYQDSLSLEQQYNPQQAALRSTSNQLQQQLAAGNTPGVAARNSMLSDITGTDNSLLSESADSILQQLRLGSALPADVQAAVVRNSLSTGGAAGLNGSFAGRGLVARDLGLTSLNLLSSRQQAAQTAGQVGLNASLTAAGQDNQTVGLLGELINGQPLPESGLNSGAIASLYTGNNNANNQNGLTQAAIQSQATNSSLNALLGFGSTALTAYQKSQAGIGGQTSYADFIANNPGSGAAGSGLYGGGP